MVGAVVSSDHADESLCATHLGSAACGNHSAPSPRLISPEEVLQHNQPDGSSSFWAVVDGYVCDATDFVGTHPGGLRKLLSSNNAEVGATGHAFGFSFSRGRNAHFPKTGQRFHDGVKRYLEGIPSDGASTLPPCEVIFAEYGKVLILGQLDQR